jgi:(heptosyl)LPS beta-1,4-glucosyltransferase
MAGLVAVILTKNEAQHIQPCIASLITWVDGVVVWDSGSSDATCELALAAGAWVVRRPFDNYATQRQTALDAICAAWILFVDADERATPALADEVQALIATAPASLAGGWIPRRNFIAGRETRGGGFAPDYQLRLLRRGAAYYDQAREVHETVTLEGTSQTLQAPLLHYNYANWSHFHKKQPFYARYEARILARRGIRPRPHNFVLQPWREFHRRLITLRGWQDGIHGLRLAFWLAWYYGFLPYWLLWRREAP